MNTEQKEGITIIDFFKIIKKNIIILLVSCLIFMILGLVYVFAISVPTYQSSCKVMIQFNNQQSETSDITNSLRIVSTVAEFMQDDMVLKEACEVLKSNGIDVTAKEIERGLTISYGSTSLNITVKFESSREDICDDVVNTVIACSEEIVARTKNDDGEPYYKSIYNAISQIGSASVPVNSSISKIVVLIAFILIGGVLGVLGAVVRNLLDNTITNKNEIEETYGIMVIGEIPEFEFNKRED